MARQIKKKLLIHDVTVNKRSNGTSWNRENATEINVTNTLVQSYVSNNSYDNGNEMVKGKALLFYDYINSSNDGGLSPTELFTIGDIVLFNGNKFHVLSIENTPTTANHHLEVILS